MGFWENVQVIVEKQNTKYRYLAEKLGVSETTVSGWRRTNVLPRADHAAAIAVALGVSVEYLLTGKNPADWEERLEADRRKIKDSNDALRQQSSEYYDSPEYAHAMQLQRIGLLLSELSHDQLSMIEVQIKALAELNGGASFGAGQSIRRA